MMHPLQCYDGSTELGPNMCQVLAGRYNQSSSLVLSSELS